MTIPFTNIDKLYINNVWVKPQGGDTEAVLNPATEEIIGHAPLAGLAETEAAIMAAREAFDNGPWPRMSFRERAAVMRKMHAVLTRRLPEIQALAIAEVGTTMGLAYSVQTLTPMSHMMAGIEYAEAIVPTSGPLEINPPWVPGQRDSLGLITVIKEPWGVVAGITGYNFPFLLNMAKVVPALLAGCTIVLKPSPFTPFSALLFGQIAEEVGFPKGVINVVNGGLDCARMLTEHPAIDMVTFTGSDKVGALIAAQAAPTLKKVHTELGGKSALIVRADADVTKAAYSAAGGLTSNCGQGCALLTRFLVHNSVRGEFVATMKGAMEAMKVGNPIDPTTAMGPLIRASQRDTVERYVQAGHDGGAKLVTGGKRPEHLDKGFYYTPTLFDDVDNSSKLAQEEVFGPVGAVIGFDTDEEAVKLANDSVYGLGAGIMSADPAQAYRMALQLRTGGVSINGGFGGIMSTFGPFGGYKRSGVGREYGPGWINEYLQEKTIGLPAGL
ncbi:MAG TPA: aldehyde dehydrogenase family protein [Novosphingobium sp.]|nr:aldehyde dehydrogenase family protein [Novosphingobium sp.]